LKKKTTRYLLLNKKKVANCIVQFARRSSSMQTDCGYTWLSTWWKPMTSKRNVNLAVAEPLNRRLNSYSTNLSMLRWKRGLTSWLRGNVHIAIKCIKFRHSWTIGFCKRRASNNYLMCDQCDFKTVHPVNLKGHYAALHGGENPFTCPICNKGFFKKSLMLRHYKEHTDKPKFICYICGCDFKHPNDLTRHTKTVHSNLFSYECKQCSQKFKTLNHIYRHALIHADFPAYECSICHEKFKINSAAYTHKKGNHGGQGQVLKVRTAEVMTFQKSLVMKITPTEKTGTQRFRPSAASADTIPLQQYVE